MRRSLSIKFKDKSLEIEFLGEITALERCLDKIRKNGAANSTSFEKQSRIKTEKIIPRIFLMK
ncbi:hypothetical protein LEP1GSC190_16505 [Leptospira mayottensis 200901116]|uniref:Uncharacterized protein n=2 Tax=Leptospira mayottensis TaxID=1137606 RepID=A0AA87MRN3_9LEPT|nr:hypothetical protein DQM28_04235 [Leptospira mayottensis]AZQ03377.1 hypothetical protein LEP1GSC190_16505 [Leptospira mayottensis 200901116]EKS01418.1 hypothetical protein LEP1GSC125_0240 [Leptospira mayottensis 200901122]